MPASAGAIRAGRAYVELFADDSKLVRGLKSAQSRLAAFGASVSKIGGMLAGAGASIGLVFVPAIKAASRLEETMNKFNIVFGQNAGAVKQWGDDFAKQVGRSKQQIASFLAGSQDLFVPLGFDPAAAEGLSKRITELAVDLASFNSMADEDTLRDLHAALTGSGEVMKKYGVIVSEAAVKQELLNQSIDPQAASEQQKVMARLNIILRGTTSAHGDATKSANSFENQMKRLKGELENTAAAIGDVLLPIVTPMVKWLGTAATSAGEWAKENQGLVKAAAQVAAALVLVGSPLVAVGGALTAVGLAMGGLATILPTVGALLGAVFSPIGAGVAIVAVLTAGIWELIGGFKGVLKALGPLGEQFRRTFDGMTEALTGGQVGKAVDVFWSMLKLAWTKGTAAIESLWMGLRDSIALVWVDLIGTLQGAWQEFLSVMARPLRAVGVQIDVPDGASDTAAIKQELLAGSARRQGELNDEVERATKAWKEAIDAVNRGPTADGAGEGASKAAQRADQAARIIRSGPATAHAIASGGPAITSAGFSSLASLMLATSGESLARRQLNAAEDLLRVNKRSLELEEDLLGLATDLRKSADDALRYG